MSEPHEGAYAELCAENDRLRASHDVLLAAAKETLPDLLFGSAAYCALQAAIVATEEAAS